MPQFEQSCFHDRSVFGDITFDNRITGIIGPRGIGKTTFLLEQALEAGAKARRALYVSADNLFFSENRLVDLADYLYKQTDVSLWCIDEIHKYPNWNRELKNIADTYWDLRVAFSGSSMIDIIHSRYDLSRRVTLHRLHGLSFREYLHFFHDIEVPLLNLADLVTHHIEIANSLGLHKPLKYFKEYLRVGYYPFFDELSQENDKFQAISNTTQKTIYEDIAVLHSLKTSSLQVIEKLYQYTIHAQAGELSAYKLAQALNKDFDSVKQYLHFLEQAGLIRVLPSKKVGKSAMRKPMKVYPDNTNLIYASYLPLLKDSTIGKIRETFVMNQLTNAGFPVYHSDQGDFSVDKWVFEVGGPNKTLSQIKDHAHGFVLADGIETGRQRVIPLYLLGLLY